MAEERQIIETTDENGNSVAFEIYDTVKVDDDEYALLKSAEDEVPNQFQPVDTMLMKMTRKGDDVVFSAIENDAEFQKVIAYYQKNSK